MGADYADEQRVALVALVQSRPDGLSYPELTAEVIEAGDALTVWEQHYPTGLFDNADAEKLLAEARDTLREWEAGPFTLQTLFDASYPEQVRSVRQMPPLLFTQGEVVAADRAVSVVGSRRASARGLQFAERVAQLLTDYQLTVVAGLAEGIDTAAHTAALRAGGRTVAVLGNGLDYFYPRSNRDLQAEIGRRGMLLSQFAPGFAPTKWSFPARNAVMSAYGIATVIAEAGEHSGTRIQAREAVAHGRAVVLSEAVALATSWGAALVGQPGVHVARTPDEALRHVEQIVELDDRVTELLASVG